jgi:hypothetical protein
MSEILFAVVVAIALFCGLKLLEARRRVRAERYLARVRHDLPSLALTPLQVADFQLGIELVGSGRNRIAVLGFDHLDMARGVGQVVVVVTSGPVFDQTIGPAIQARFGAMRPVS